MAKQTRRHFLRITALSGASLVFGCDCPPEQRDWFKAGLRASMGRELFGKEYTL